MEFTEQIFSGKQGWMDVEDEEDTQKRAVISSQRKVGMLDLETDRLQERPQSEEVCQVLTHQLQVQETTSKAEIKQAREVLHEYDLEKEKVIDKTASVKTRKLPEVASFRVRVDIPGAPLSIVPYLQPASKVLTRERAFFLVILLTIVILNATNTGFSQFFGPQGWGTTFSDSSNSSQSLLNTLQEHEHPTPGATAIHWTPLQTVNFILSKMSLDEKLGQMMMVQFSGQDYSSNLSTMISQYKVGSVLFFQFNIGSNSQLTELASQMQHNAFLPLAIAVDQEGGTVDRLVNLDGPQPSAASIGATIDTNKAYQQGIKDAQNLSNYGFNLNLAPVVDVSNVYNPQLDGRTYGNNPTIVTKMAGAYLNGLQKSGKVLGTLKHFPGLGDVAVDPHVRPPDLLRSLNDLNAIDWVPYRNLINQGKVYAIMVTHEMVPVLDNTNPSSLSPQVIGILRNQMNFPGVIMTDSLTMDSIHNTYTYAEAAAKAVEVGDDLLMGAASPNDLAAMIKGIKQAISSGNISQQHIDDSVRRILLMKYAMGYLHIVS